MKEIKYKYAYDADQNKKLVSIDDVVNNSIRDHSFFCINCGQELIPAIGKTNVPHFKHKTNVKCDGESYLHKLAKLRIHDLFYDFTKPFNIKFTRAICKQKEEQSCPAFTSLCTKHKITTFDLHEYYNVCDIEKKIHIEKNGNNSFCNFVKEDDSQTYIPDLLLTKEGSLNNPILIEIWNKHKSSDEKIKTGLRIIEIKIFSEEDIDSICKTLCLSSDDVMEAFNGLMIKGLAQLESVKDKDLKMITEKVSINHVYEEITLDIQKSSEVEVTDDVYKKFEHELGRPMSSMELEIINGWISKGIKEEIIIGALKEAVYNGVTRFNYIDKIIFEWDSKGFKTMDDVKKHQELRRKEKSKDKVISKKEQAILDFDWLGE